MIFLNCLLTFLKDLKTQFINSGVLELFLNLFLIISKTFLEHNIFMKCSVILLEVISRKAYTEFQNCHVLKIFYLCP